MNSNTQGFVLIELLVVIAILGILFYTVITALQPGKNFSLARNTSREVSVQMIAQSVVQNKLSNNGNFNCPAQLPSVATPISSAPGGVNICSCIIPTFLPAMPVDPGSQDNYFNSCSDFVSGYSIFINAEDKITVTAPGSELGTVITYAL